MTIVKTTRKRLKSRMLAFLKSLNGIITFIFFSMFNFNIYPNFSRSIKSSELLSRAQKNDMEFNEIILEVQSLSVAGGAGGAAAVSDIIIGQNLLLSSGAEDLDYWPPNGLQG